MTIDTTNMCSHLKKKLFELDGVYYPIWQAMKDDETLTAVVRSRQPTNEARAEMSLLNLCLARRRKANPTAHLQEWEQDSHSRRSGPTAGNTTRQIA